MQLRTLGSTDITISPLGLGCWQFSGGKGLIGGFWQALEPETVRSIVAASLEGGINWFDTAEAYGWGESEIALSQALRSLEVDPEDIYIATKWFPVFRRAASIRATFPERESCLRPYPITLHQIHNPLSLSSVESQIHAMADLVEEGRLRAIGVSNFSAKAMDRAARVAEQRGVPLVSNQVRYSLLYRKVESNGVLSAAKDHGITLIAYSPLEQGILTGKFHDQPDLIRSRVGPRKFLRWFKPKGLEQSRPLIDLLREIAQKYEVAPEQVALNWLIHFSGETVVAIPGASKARHAESNVRALSFTLNEDELARIDQCSREVLNG
ncbi:MAG: aldo/keto reductase [Candidatus Neomarinimicrobiota bacterium]|nr:MAG: aldo/keto reductase [Candidatus Neomarinimicrobiota bacterium]